MSKRIDSITRMGLGQGHLSDLPPLPEGTSPGWKESDWRLAEGKAAAFLAGSWEGSVGEVAVEYGYDEFCFITRGRVALQDTEGGRVEFSAGDAFHIPRGFAGRWITLEPASKHYVIVE